jgi:mono/diheme cytochrome c family protein
MSARRFAHPLFAGLLLAATALIAPAEADASRDQILAALLAEAQQADPGLAGFSAERGAAFYAATQSGGKPDTPSCASCHGASPREQGRTRAGKEIAPMAVSLTPDRFTDPAKVEKWFGRNCNSVLGRDCTSAEKGDFIAYLMGQ